MATKDDSPDGGGAIPDEPTVLAERRLREALPDAVVEAQTTGLHPYVRVTPEGLRAACRLLRDDEELQLDCLHLISGVDWPKEEELEVVYHLVSYTRKADAAYRNGLAEGRPKNDPFVALKVRVPREKPEVPSVVDLWTGADWHERETWDLMGIVFTGRKELRRILLPEDWPGHPLRKDWAFPVSYHGTPIIPPEAQ